MIWYSDKIENVAKELKTDLSVGLSSAEAAKRLTEVGENKLTEKKKKTFLQRFMEQMKDVMIIILLIAAVISLILNFYHVSLGEEGDWIEPIVIVMIVIINAVLGVVQESKAEAALEALKNMSSPEAKVLRDGVITTVKSTDLVPGDIVNIEAGDLIPADCRLISSASFKCDEAALTGESVPAEKNAAAEVSEIAPLGDRLNMAYAGCAASYGHAKAIIVETAMGTEMGKIATMLDAEETGNTPLQDRLAKLGKSLGILALVICLIIFAIGLFRAEKITPEVITGLFMQAVSLAVAAIPEGLPAIVTIVLAIGVQRMVTKNAIIRRLPAVETLGSASVICSDKTGTLTQNRMTLVKVYNNKDVVPLSDDDAPDSVTALLRLATLCTDGSVRIIDGVEKHIGDPTETAIIAAAAKYGLEKEILDAENPRIGEIPFDSDRKLMTSVNLINEKNIVIVKGAPDILFSRCVWDSEENRQAAIQANEDMAKDALRVLAVAYKTIEGIPVEFASDDLENGLVFGGLVGMIDPPRPEAMLAIEECKSAGIKTVMITGDHITTAIAIAKQLGILQSEDQAITGAELAKLSDDELIAKVDHYRVYARVSPSDKIRIVKAWQATGQVVAMTGDGVNDAPALKAADIGCAMGITGTDVAKGAADMTLTDDNFATIVTAVKEGRGIYDNIRKAVHFLLSCNLGEVITVFVAVLLFKEGSPLAPIQLLWVNLVTDSLPALALGVEPVEADVMNHKPRRKDESIFAGGLGKKAVLHGLMVGILTLIGYFVGSRVFTLPSGEDNAPLGQTMAFATLAISQLFHAFNVRSSKSIFKVGITSNKKMVAAFFASLFLMIIVLCIPALEVVFNVTQMNLGQYAIVGLLSITPIFVGEISKLIARMVKK